MLLEANKLATEVNVSVAWVHCDALKYTPTKTFDAVICLCEGAFGLVGRDEEPVEHDLAITDEGDLPEGKKQVEVKERRYLPFELKQMFSQVELKVENKSEQTLFLRTST